MKTFLMSCFVLPFIFAATVAQAADSLQISDARIFAPIKGSTATAAYGVFKNTSNKPVSLKVQSAEQFKAVEMHQTKMLNGQTTMDKVEGLTIKPQESFEFKPGADHIMLFDSLRTLKEGETLKITFLVDGVTKAFDFKVVPRVMGSDMHHH